MTSGRVDVRRRQHHRFASSSLSGQVRSVLPPVEEVEPIATTSSNESKNAISMSFTHLSTNDNRILGTIMMATAVDETNRQVLYGPGGAVLRSRTAIRRLLSNDSIAVHCLTWNLAGKVGLFLMVSTGIV